MYNYTHTAMDPSAMDTSLEPLYLLQWSIDIKNMRTLSVSVFVCALQTTTICGQSLMRVGHSYREQEILTYTQIIII